MERILIIGGGGTGGALAHDLTLRGFEVVLVEQGSLLSGTSGRHHGLLHSGARYVLHDVATARECYVENQILRRNRLNRLHRIRETCQGVADLRRIEG